VPRRRQQLLLLRQQLLLLRQQLLLLRQRAEVSLPHLPAAHLPQVVEPATPGDGLATVALTVCPRCGARYAEGLKFCPFDGEALAVLADSDRPPDPLLGCVIAERYRIEGILAEGGMGMVYRVSHTTLSNPFAMKVLRRELAADPAVAARLVEEARATAAIDHPAIVEVTDFGEIDSSVLPELGAVSLPYFVMEYVEGQALDQIIRERGRLPIETVIHIMSSLASALSAAHAVGIVHRDLKPANIRIEPNGTVRVLDFGVAKVLGASRQTQKGLVFGTPQYMSPEQAQGEAVDGRSDVYALGVLMYQCATGTVPFEADSYMGVVTQHMFEIPEPFAVVAAELAGHPLESVVMRCLEKDPAARFQTMDEFRAELQIAQAAIEAGESPPLSVRPPGRGLKLRQAVPVAGSPAARDLAHPRRVSGPWVVAIFLVLGVCGAAAVWGLRHALSGQALSVAPSEAATASAGATPSAARDASADIDGDDTPAPGIEPAATPASGHVAAPASPPTATSAASVRSVGTVRPTRRPRTVPRAPSAAPPRPPPPRTKAQGDVVDPW
jgi:serine/threonine-protein kinase